MTLQEQMDELETLADSLGIGRYQLYGRIGVSASNWSRWKSGEHHPSYRKLAALQRVLGELKRETENGPTGDGGRSAT